MRTAFLITQAAAWGLGIALIVTQTGCMQLTGIQEMDAWGLKIKSTTGFEVAAGVQQYDTVIDKRGINPERNGTTKLEKY
jgi:hypothetical protein